MAMEFADLNRLQVNQESWQPNAYLLVKRRYFQRKDGYVFAVPESEDWHILRLLATGWQEVSGPEAEPESVRRHVAQQQASHQAQLAAKKAEAEDPRDAQIAVLIDLVKQLTAQQAAQKEPGDASPSGNAPDHRQGARAGR